MGICWELRPEHTGETDIQQLGWFGDLRARRRQNKIRQERREEVEPLRAFVGQVEDFASFGGI